MRARGVATATTVITLVLGATAVGVAAADDGPGSMPSRQDVRDARTAVRAQADDVAEVRARLAVANQRLEQSSIAAAQASEAFNGARWRAQQARAAADKARAGSAAAQADVVRQRAAYTDSVVTSYELAPGLTAVAAVMHADGIDAVLQRSATLANATDALDGNYDRFRAAAVVADVARQQADDTQRQAEQAEDAARDAQQAAQQAEDAAAADAQSIAAEKTALIARLAELQHVSVRLAQRRQSALEARAARLAAEAARKAAQQAARQAAREAAREAARRQAEQEQQADATQAPDPEPITSPTPTPPAPTTPAPSSGAQAAIAFARAQFGEPYRWAVAGPDAWDCSGLTSGAWAAGGISLPHYSVAQYEQSTPISPSQLQPGDLVFWGSSSNPSSIYHVALYVGNGRIIQAPRTGENVEETSMYAWITPNFYARP